MRKQSGASRLAAGTGPQHLRARVAAVKTIGTGSPLLRQLAAQVWDEVTGGAGVVVDSAGKPVQAVPAKRKGGKA